MIIGISGYAGSGKDQLGQFISLAIDRNRPNGLRSSIHKFAGPIKRFVSDITGIPEWEMEDREVKDKRLGDEWGRSLYAMSKFGWTELPPTLREFLQDVGMKMREIHPDFWVNAVFSHPDFEAQDFVVPIITDVRFPNELKRIKDSGGVVIRIDRPGVGPVNGHTSETALDRYKFDYKVANVSDLESLKQTAEVLVGKIFTL
jgi:hypothetical protein